MMDYLKLGMPFTYFGRLGDLVAAVSVMSALWVLTRRHEARWPGR
jgi:hypothetical protein